jgi:hypothetical protein
MKAEALKMKIVFKILDNWQNKYSTEDVPGHNNILNLIEKINIKPRAQPKPKFKLINME